jgi:YD repeat-containing protein
MRRTLGLLVVLAFVAVGCGGDDECPGPCERYVDIGCDGSGVERIVYSYNEEGHVVGEERYDGDRLYSRSTYELDSQGNIIREDYVDGINSPAGFAGHYTYKYEFDESGNITVQEKYSDPDGTPLERLVHQYDEDGRLVTTELDESGQPPEISTYSYDDQGNLVTQEVDALWAKDPGDRPDTLYTYQYDDNGNLMVECMDSGADGTMHKCTTYVYDCRDTSGGKASDTSFDPTGIAQAFCEQAAADTIDRFDIGAPEQLDPGIELSLDRQAGRLSASTFNVCALRDDNTVLCWGEGGLPSIPQDEELVYIATGEGNAGGLREDGTAVCWSRRVQTDGPPQGEHFVSLTSGNYFTCGLRQDGRAICWGDDTCPTCQSIKRNGFVELHAGYEHVCGLRQDGSAYCWGLSFRGQASVPEGERFVSLSAARDNSCGLRADGTVVCWGSGYGFVGEGQASPSTLPPFVQITNGCGLLENGSVMCWGGGFSSVWTPFEGLTFVHLASGNGFVCGLQHSGSIFCSTPNGRGLSACDACSVPSDFQ